MKKVIACVAGSVILLASGIELIRKVRKSAQKYESDMKKRHDEEDKFIKEHEKFLKESEKELNRMRQEREALEKRHESLYRMMNETYSKVNENFKQVDSCEDDEKRIDILHETEKILDESMDILEKEGIIKRPWKGDFEEFMSNPNNQLEFN